MFKPRCLSLRVLGLVLGFTLPLASFALDRTLLLESKPSGAEVFINGQSMGLTPLTIRKHEFKRNSRHVIEVRKANHATQQRVVDYDEARSVKREPWQIAFDLPEIQREIPVQIVSNIEGAEVYLDDKKIGQTPLRHPLVFVRTNGTADWPRFTLRIQKEGYEYLAPGGKPEAVFSRTVTAADAAQGTLRADHFVVASFVYAPVRYFQVAPEGVAIVATNFLSQVTSTEQGKPASLVTTATAERPLVLSRIATRPGDPESFAYSLPLVEERPAADGARTEAVIVGANIVLRTRSGTTPMTTGKFFDLDPFVTTEWIYFSSDRSNMRIIWRVPLSGRGGYTPITGVYTKLDTEPALSQDGNKLAYTSRYPDAPETTPSHIWIAEADGKLPTLRWPGRSPAWSPDGTRLAFVSPANKLCVADLTEGGVITELTFGDSQIRWPVWAPSGKNIVYASDEGINDRKERNFDIWVISVEGTTKRKLTSDGSFDSAPALSSDVPLLLYFFSNRGATRPGQEQLQIYRFEPGML